MPHVSSRRLSKQTEEKLIQNLNSVFTHIGKDDDMLAFAGSLLSDTEKLMLAKRLAIVILLEEGLPESHIADMLHVTRITVEKMRFLYGTEKQHGFRIALKKLEEQKKLETFKKFLVSLARYSIRASSGRVNPTILD